MDSATGASSTSRMSRGVLSIRHSNAAAETVDLDNLAEVEALLVSLLAELLLETESTSMEVLCVLLRTDEWCLSKTAGHNASPESTHSMQQQTSHGMPNPCTQGRSLELRALLVSLYVIRAPGVCAAFPSPLPPKTWNSPILLPFFLCASALKGRNSYWLQQGHEHPGMQEVL